MVIKKVIDAKQQMQSKNKLKMVWNGDRYLVNAERVVSSVEW